MIPNGRGYLVNGTTLFGSIVEYHCLPDFKMIGESQQRKCLATGDWQELLILTFKIYFFINLFKIH